VAVKKLRDDAPLIKKRLDPPVLLKKISDDVPIPVPAGRPPVVLPGRGGLSPFLLATGHHAAVGDVQGRPAAIGGACRPAPLSTASVSATSSARPSRAPRTTGVRRG
jgi:hypothetical protein